MQAFPEVKNKLQEKNSCLSQRELLNYSNAKLSEKEKRKVEMHMLECEKCISLYQDVLNKKETADINGKYSDLFPEGEKSNFKINFISKRKLFTIAAVLFGVIVLYGAYSRLSRNSVKNDSAYSPISEQEKTNPEPVKNQEPISSVPVKDEKIIQPPPENENKTTEEIKNQSIPEEIKVVEKKNDEAAANKTKPIKDELQKPVEKVNNPPAVAVPPKNELTVKDTIPQLPAPPVSVFIKNYKVSKSPDEPETGKYAKGLEIIFMQIDKSDYKNALSEIGKFLNDYPNDINGKYYKGFIYYQEQDNDQALTEMNSILNKRDKIFYDDARWYKALILNRTQKPDEAKKILNDLASKNGSYSFKAKQLLELMGEK